MRETMENEKAIKQLAAATEQLGRIVEEILQKPEQDRSDYDANSLLDRARDATSKAMAIRFCFFR